MKRFVLIGAAGYVAPRHMRAIRDTGNTMVAALDPNDSVGIIDSYFPESAFFTEFERFDRYVSKLKRGGLPIDYVSVCSPNYLHDAHIRFGLRNGADVICEKPLVLNPWNVEGLQEIEKDTGQRVYTILQLRLHPALQELKRQVDAAPPGKVFDVNLTYITSRGNWYFASWKGDIEKSGGIATNIGIHFFDMLHWIFGDVMENHVYVRSHDRASGYLRLEKARVNWFLSINSDTIADALRNNGSRTYRSITVEGKEIEFSEGFTDLHTLSYKSVLEGKGFRLEEAAQAVEIAYSIRNAQPIGLNGHEHHPLANLPLSPHPFERE
ncbi:MAG: Gfo/Idh/MocA family oxidoreductase [Saprospiraceae bacterium]